MKDAFVRRQVLHTRCATHCVLSPANERSVARPVTTSIVFPTDATLAASSAERVPSALLKMNWLDWSCHARRVATVLNCIKSESPLSLADPVTHSLAEARPTLRASRIRAGTLRQDFKLDASRKMDFSERTHIALPPVTHSLTRSLRPGPRRVRHAPGPCARTLRREVTLDSSRG